MSFYKKQKRIALRNCGLINPEDIKECIGLEGYLALGKVLSEMTPDELIKLITDSALEEEAAVASLQVKNGVLEKCMIVMLNI